MAQKRRPLPVDVEELMMAFEHHSYESSYYFDKETGDVLFFPDEILKYIEIAEDSLPEMMPDWQVKLVSDARQMDAHPGRFIQVEPVPSHEAYRIMEDFIGTVEVESLRLSLWRAIQGGKPFRRFKDALLDDPEERERWFQFKDEHYRNYVLEWLAILQIKPV